MKDRQWQQHCTKCNSRRSAEVHGAAGRFTVLIPSACKTKDACEVTILRLAGIVPVTHAGEIVR